MSRAEKRRRRRARRDREAFAELARSIEEDLPGKLGISWEDALNLVSDGARELQGAYREHGLVTRVPYGAGVSFDARTLVRSMRDSLSIFEDRLRELDATDDPSDGEALRLLTGVTSPVISLGACVLLYLVSAPVPVDLLREVRAVPVGRRGDA